MRTPMRTLAPALILMLMALAGCGQSEAPPPATTTQPPAQAEADTPPSAPPPAADPSSTVVNSVADVRRGLGDIAQRVLPMPSTELTPLEPEQLGAVLPDALPGYERDERAAERNMGFGAPVTEVRQPFHNADRSKRLRFSIIDPGTLTGPVSMAHAWMSVEINEQNGDDYEKTRVLNGRKLHQKWQAAKQQGELTTVVGERFIVEVSGDGVPMDELHGLLEQVDLKTLEGLRRKSGPPAAGR